MSILYNEIIATIDKTNKDAQIFHCLVSVLEEDTVPIILQDITVMQMLAELQMFTNALF